MTASLAPRAAATPPCPAWCTGHLPADYGVVHVSAGEPVVVSSGPEVRTLSVSIEADSAGEPAVRLLGAGGVPMTPAQAMRLAGVLQAAAFAVISERR